MFLVDTALAASDWQGVNDEVKAILEKFDAEIVSMKKWDERRLAYDIKSTSRGTYILVFFRVEGPKITEIERACKLSEKVIRVLILSDDNFDEDNVNKDTPATAAEKRVAKALEAAEAAEAAKAAEAESDDKDASDIEDAPAEVDVVAETKEPEPQAEVSDEEPASQESVEVEKQQ